MLLNVTSAVVAFLGGLAVWELCQDGQRSRMLLGAGLYFLGAGLLDGISFITVVHISDMLAVICSGTSTLVEGIAWVMVLMALLTQPAHAS